MKPKPLLSLNHLTVPVSMRFLKIKITAPLRSDKNFKEEERIASTAQEGRKMMISNRAS
jgi:hypothetical protein